MRCRSSNRSERSAATKLSDIELPDDVKPANSHVALNTIVDDDGEQRQIMRFNMPFGRVGAGEFGTYFIGYARSPDVIEQMLTEHVHRQAARQLRPDPRLLNRGDRQPVLRARRRLPRGPARPRRALRRPQPTGATEDDSLGIGSLRAASQ